MSLRILMTAGLALAALVAAACSGDKHNGAPVAVSVRDFTVAADKPSIQAGKITLTIENSGPSTHELAVFRTDLAASRLPVVDNIVPEDAPEIELIDEVESIKTGTTKKLTVQLQPGHYALICNILEHYQKGMYFDLTAQ